MGYSNDEVDKAVIENITKGNMSTLNCKGEVELAEKLIEICSPWGDMVRFARSGGEANAIAVRIARAAQEKIMSQFVDIMVGMTGIYLQTYRVKMN